MPPESLPWDRKDFFKDRKRDRSLDPVGHAPRWRDSPHHGTSSPRDYNRWGAGGYRNRTPGHGKQGGWHRYPEQTSHGFAPYRPSEGIASSFRPSESIGTPYRPTERFDTPYRPSERMDTPYRPTERMGTPSYRPNEKMGTPYRPTERMDTPYRPTERMDTPYRPTERMDTPYRPTERMDTPYRPTERMDTPYRPTERMDTPYRLTERMDTPYRSSESMGSPYRTPFRPSDSIATPYRSIDRAPTPYRSVDSAASPFGSERGATPFRSERGATPFRSDRGSTPFRPERGSTPYRSIDSVASPLRYERGATPLRPERGSTPYRSIDSVASPLGSERGATPLGSERGATPLRSERGPTPLRSERGPTPLRSERGATPFRSERGSTPFRPERSSTPFRSSEKASSPYRSSEKIVDGETWRSSEPRVDGKCNRSIGDSRPLFYQKDSEAHPLENGGPTDGSSKQLNVSAQRSVDDMPTDNSLPHSNAISTTDQFHLKDQNDTIDSDNSLPHSNVISTTDQFHVKDLNDKIDSDNSLPRSDSVDARDQFHLKDQHDKIDSVSALGTGLRSERASSLGSIDWKPHRWTRSGSLSARSSGFSQLSGSKRFGADFSEAKAEAQDKTVNQVESQSGDAAGCAQAALSEETSSRKKPRVRWGEGLAKYEKKKVDAPDGSATTHGVVDCSSIEASCSDLANLAEKSPRLASFPGFASPTTPSSVGYSSSPGIEEKRFLDTSTTDNAASKSSGSSDLHLGDIFGAEEFDLESLDATAVANLSSSLCELLQSNDPSSEDSSFVRATVMKKLMVLKGSVTKALETAESEIDSLENELKSLASDSRTNDHCPATSSSLPGNSEVKTSEDQVAGSDPIPQVVGLQLVSSVNHIVEDQKHNMEEVPDSLRGEGADSPGTATSKPIEPLSSLKDDVPIDQMKYKERSVDLGAIKPEVPINSSECPIGMNLYGYREAKSYELIIASNKECASRASDLFRKLLPSDQCGVGMSRTSSVSNGSIDTFIKEKFVARKQFLKFKERVYTLKFMVFRRLWREDMQLLSVRKNRAKSQKRLESSFQTLRGSNQKHRSSVRSRFSPGKDGNLSVAPSAEVIKFTSKLLSGSHFKLRRNELRMPAMVLDKKEKIAQQFVSKNGLVQDPIAVEKERALINPWTTEEKDIFMDKLAAFGKDFGKIASFLDHKRTADCIEFYYKNHKEDWFRKTKKKPKLAGQGESCSTHNYLVTSEKRWNREADAASLDMLGAVSAVVANAGDGMKRPKNCASGSLLGAAKNRRAPQLDDVSVERTDNFDALDSDRETVAVGVLAGICGSLSSEAMSSCITSSLDPAESQQDSKSQKVVSSMRRPLTPEVDDDTCSDESYDEGCGEYWTEEEKSAFIQAFTAYGKDLAMITKCVRTKSEHQCRLFFGKGRSALGLTMIAPGSGNNKAPVSDGTDSEDACDLPNGSVIYSEKSESKLDDGLVSAQKMDVEMNNCSEVDEDAISRSNVEELMKTVPEVDKDMVGVNLKTTDSNPADTVNLNRSEEDYRTGEIELNNPGAEQEHLVADVLMGECKEQSLNVEEDGGTGSGFVLDQPVACEMSIDHDLAVSGADGETAANKGYSADLESKQLPPENISANEDTNVDANICVSQQVDCSEQDLDTSRNASDVAVDANTLVEYPEKEHQTTTLEVHPSSGPLSSSFGQVVSPSHCAIGIGKSSYEQQSINSADAEVHNNPQSKLAVSPSASCQVASTPLIPVAATGQETSGTCSEVGLNSRSGLNLLQGCFLQKCSSSEARNPAIEIPFLSLDKRPNHGKTSSDSAKPSKSGDVKLFGKILTSSTSTAEQNSNCNGGTRESDHHSGTHQPADWRTGTQQNASFRGFGFWDGNRIQAGPGSSLPDSSVLLAKYPAAFASYPTAFSNEPQPPLMTNNGQYFSSGELPVYRNNGQLPPFNFDVMQRRNGTEGFPVAARRGIFSGEPLTGAVSDPVAAIKLHYAKAQLERLEGRSSGEARRT